MNIQDDKPYSDMLRFAEENLGKIGNLTIFLGMAAGVGKTYAMLEEARQLKLNGQEPVIGIVYTHGQQELDKFLEGLTKLPEEIKIYKGDEYYELDLKAVLSLKPSLVIVDELAHTNIPGGLHTKRWQDVNEILENGIDVFTTLNIQNIESLKDIMEGILGRSIRETVPDLIIEKAGSVHFIDITPEQLLERLHKGKVFIGEQSQKAVEQFFQMDRLTALREISLRYTAEKIHSDLNKLPHVTETRIDWKPREKFLVAVSHSHHSQKLIRTGRRLASNVSAPWIALHVDSGKVLNEFESQQLDKNLTLASQLGAEVITVHSLSVIDGIKNISREQGVTQILIGRPPKISFLTLFIQSALIDKLAAECTDIDIHVIRQDRYNVQFQKRSSAYKPLSKFRDYFYSFLSVAAITGVNILLLPILGYKAVGFIFLLGVVILSLYLEKGSILFASLLFAAIWSFFFIPPLGTFNVTYAEDLVLLILYVLSAMALGIFLERARRNRELLIKSQKTTDILFDFVKAMAENKDWVSVCEFIKKRLSILLDGSIDIVIEEKNSPIASTSILLKNEQEKSAFIWAFSNGKEAGWQTDTLATCQNLYLPLVTQNDSVGVLIYRSHNMIPLSIDDKKFLYTACRQLASYIDRVQTEKKVKEAEQIRQIERTHGILLKRFALLFEKPIEKAKKALLAIKGKSYLNNEEINEIDNSLEIVTKTFSNVSAMSQLIEGLVPLEKERHRADEIVRECCDNIKKSYPECPIKFYSDSELPAFDLDYYLIKILIINVLMFFVENSKTGSNINVQMKRINHKLILTFQCAGMVLPNETLAHIFDKPSTNERVGILLAKSIAEVHEGTLTAECQNEADLLFTFSISLDRIFFG